MISTPPESDCVTKEASLTRWLKDRGSVLVAFSGGVDSASLAVASHTLLGKHRVLSVLGVSASLARDMHERARTLARDFGVRFREVATHEFDDPNYVANRGDRCFHCKQELWSRLVPIAQEEGLAAVVDGTIADDLDEHRPGMRAGQNAGVQSPLADCGFTKADVRALARRLGIPMWDAPGAPCLSSRLMTGISVNAERLLAIDRAETGLRTLGIEGDVRVRHLGDAARVELSPVELEAWRSEESRMRIARVVQDAGFDRVLFDERGYRRGSLNERGSTEVTDITVTCATSSRDTSL